MVRDLVTLAPQMVFIPDRNGDYPLHSSINNQQSYNTTYHLFKAFPEAASIQDVRTKLLPFMLAATGDWENEEDQITTTYQLLIEDPFSVVGGLKNTKSSSEDIRQLSEKFMMKKIT